MTTLGAREHCFCPVQSRSPGAGTQKDGFQNLRDALLIVRLRNMSCLKPPSQDFFAGVEKNPKIHGTFGTRYALLLIEESV
jgi:hypothetical protein